MPAATDDLHKLLDALLDARVEFVVVGGGAAVIQGAPVTTQDLDIVYSREDHNVQRLLEALMVLEARIADPGGRVLAPTRAGLSAPGQSLLRTKFGRLDVLGRLHDGREYDELITTADTVDFVGRALKVMDLPTLIEIKSATGRAKDRLVVPVLIELARRRQQGRDESEA